MPCLLLLLVIASATAENNENTQKTSIMENLQKLRNVVLDKISPGTARKSKELEQQDNNNNLRKSKSYGYYPYIPINYNYAPPDIGYYFPQGKTPINQEWRTEPFKRKTNQQQLLDSPIYYVRLPPSPYVFVPGMGFVSRPPSLTEPGVLNSIADAKPETNGDITPDNFLHVPIDFVSNGKPTGVYQLPNDPIKQKPNQGFYNLEKGPYLFNGKPVELYVLQNSYNQMYADALTNFYP